MTFPDLAVATAGRAPEHNPFALTLEVQPMNITWSAADNGWHTNQIATPGDTPEYFVLNIEPDTDRYAWSVDYHPDADAMPSEAVSSGTAARLDVAQRNAIGALLELLTGRRGRMTETDTPLSVPALGDLQDVMWELFAHSGEGRARTRNNINGWAKLAHRALIEIAARQQSQ